MNRQLSYLDDGLNRIGRLVAQLTNHAPTAGKGSLLTSTIEMVETLSAAAHFKQAIEDGRNQGRDLRATVVRQQEGLLGAAPNHAFPPACSPGAITIHDTPKRSVSMPKAGE